LLVKLLLVHMVILNILYFLNPKPDIFILNFWKSECLIIYVIYICVCYVYIYIYIYIFNIEKIFLVQVFEFRVLCLLGRHSYHLSHFSLAIFGIGSCFVLPSRFGLQFYLHFLGCWDDRYVLTHQLILVEMDSCELFAWSGFNQDSTHLWLPSN
jgi:hypothetical protein